MSSGKINDKLLEIYANQYISACYMFIIIFFVANQEKFIYLSIFMFVDALISLLFMKKIIPKMKDDKKFGILSYDAKKKLLYAKIIFFMFSVIYLIYRQIIIYKNPVGIN